MSKKKSNIIGQASILAIAGVLSRLIGLLYRSPLHTIIGDLGLGYYQAAYSYYTIILLISSYSIPIAISQMIAPQLAIGNNQNVRQIFRCAMHYALIVGTIGSLLLYFGASFFVDVEAIAVLRVFSPTIFFYGILGVIRGFFQSYGNMVQTSISQIIEQVVNAFVSVGAAYVFVIYLGANAKANHKAVMGAMGSAIGTGMGVLIALIYILIVFSKFVKNKKENENNNEKISYKDAMYLIIHTISPFIISATISNLSNTVNTKLYIDIYPTLRMLDKLDVTAKWGVFSGQAVTISNIPVAFASAMASAMIPSVAAANAEQNKAEIKRLIKISIKTTMYICIPCAIGMIILAKPIIAFLFSNTVNSLELAGKSLASLALSTVFFSLSILYSSALQSVGNLKIPIINAGVALIIQSILSYILLVFTHTDVMGISISTTIYALIMCILNYYAVNKIFGFKQELKKSICVPFSAAGIMGIIILFFNKELSNVISSDKIALILVIGLGMIVYLFFIVIFKGIDYDELSIPVGKHLNKIIKVIKKKRE